MWTASMPSTPTPRSTSSAWIRARRGAGAVAGETDAGARSFTVGRSVVRDRQAVRRRDLRLSEPGRHVQRDEEARRREEMLLGPIPVARAEVQPTERELTARE